MPVRILPRRASHSVSRSPGSWLTLLLLFVVLVPSIGLLWFLNQAVEREQLAARQQLIDAYRAQLIAAQAQFKEKWESRFEQVGGSNARGVQTFRNVIMLNLGDAAIVYDESGNEIYPAALPKPEALSATYPDWMEAEALESSDVAAAAAAYAAIAAENKRIAIRRYGLSTRTIAARALQAQARCLMRTGDHTAALAVLDELRQDGQFRGSIDPQGRSIAPNAALLAAELVRGSDPKRAAGIRQELRVELLRNYQTMDMPSSQARFLLRDLERDAPDSSLSKLLAAEELAAGFVEADHRAVKESGLRPSPMPGIWQYRVPGQWYVTLHREENLQRRLHEIGELPTLPEDIRLEFIPPGHEPEGVLLTQVIGVLGWRLGIIPTNPQLLETATTQRIQAYTWIVALLVVSLVIVASLAWSLVRRQIALTQLRTDLVANVTHELKTPLASMRLLVETLLNTPQLNEQTTRDYLQLISTENLRLSRLIGNFLTFSRIEGNKYTFDFKTVRPQAIVDSAVAAVRDRFQAPGCRFDVQVAADLPPVTADADAVVTALVNLLDNAWKYSGETKAIVLSADARDGNVVLAVRDNGIGLAPRDAKRIFQRFYQVHQHLSSSGGGSGLGLSIVQFIVSAHRGTVSVDSEPGAGSTFTITLPAAGAQNSA